MNEPPLTTTPVEVLIVEDSPTQALLLQNILERNSYQAIIARNGKEALATLQKHKPTMVITDVNMPEMDGYELCRQIKADPDLRILR